MGKYSSVQIATIAMNVICAGGIVYFCVTVLPVYNDYSKLRKKAIEADALEKQYRLAE